MEPFFAGREPELIVLIDQARHGKLIEGPELQDAACRGTDTNLYFPDNGQPDDLALARCGVCPVRLACLATALGTEEPGDRYGWWGGLSPEGREDAAASLTSEAPQDLPSRVTEALRLRAAGWTINAIAKVLCCSRRTVQRYLRSGGRIVDIAARNTDIQTALRLGRRCTARWAGYELRSMHASPALLCRRRE